MNEEEKRAINIIKSIEKQFYENKQETNLSCYDDMIMAIDTVLNLITKLQKENEEKDKQINNAINEVENIRQYFSEDLQPEFIRVLEILKNKKVIDW